MGKSAEKGNWPRAPAALKIKGINNSAYFMIITYDGIHLQEALIEGKWENVFHLTCQLELVGKSVSSIGRSTHPGSFRTFPL